MHSLLCACSVDSTLRRYVLPNHYLFSLAERTPADMAALLSVFHPVPPVIRRRAKELLDAIRDAVKQALGAPGAASASVIDARVEEAPAAMAVDAPETVAEVVEATPAQPSQSLWTTGEDDPEARYVMPRLTPRPVSSITATKSVLFGASLRSNTANVLPIAQQSALLGAGSSKAQVRNIRHSLTTSLMPDTPRKQELARGLAINRARFLEAAIRIHSKLVIAPSVPSLIAQSTPDSAAQAAAAATGKDDPTVLKNEGHAEIPFIPASQRAAPVTVDDTIVVVGQPKKKKRKRVADKEKADTAAGTASPKEEGEMEAEAFDYTSVSNILDDGSDHEADLPNAKKRQKHAKGGS